ncbi:ABC transporter substrate-binding protein [Thermoproteota archaeon]
MLKEKIQTTILCSLLILSALIIAIPFPVQSQENLFTVTLTTPSTNPSRQAWSEIIQQNMIKAGINAQRVIQDWGTIYDRALDPPPEIVGKIFDEGGFDMLFVGYAQDIDPDPFSLYHSSQLPPGQNYYNWENEENDRLCTLIKETIDLDQLEQYAKEWQKLAYDELPSITIKYDQEGVVIDPTALEAEQFEIIHYPAWPRVQDWKLTSSTTQDTIVIAQTGPAPEEGLNPYLSTSYYDLVVFGAVFECLTKRENLGTQELIPALATSWEVADDDKTWTVNLRQGVKWHDGVEFTAEDVKFTYTAAMAEELASQQGGFVTSIIGSSNNIEIIDDYTLKFHLPAPYAFFASSLLAEGTTGWILPKHVLENVPYDEWRSHTFNTGEGSYTSNGQTFSGPIGTGPYVYDNYNPTTFTNTMNRNVEYWGAQPDIKKYVVVFIEGSDPAITALKTGEVDVLDAQYSLQTKLDSIEPSWGEWVDYDAFGLQELGINMKHPIMGTGVDTPLGQQDPSRAAEAARYVRQAISHLVPRQNIIDTILDGYGNLGVTTPFTTLTFGYDDSLEPYSFDIEMAKSLLAAAGYETGVPPPSKDFLEEYGLYVGVAIVAVVVALGAVYFIRRRQS